MKIIITESQLQVLKESQQYLDVLLDKINKGGMESLSNKERQDLVRISNGEQIHINSPEVDPDPNVDINDLDDDVDVSDPYNMVMYFSPEYYELQVGDLKYMIERVEEYDGDHLRVSGVDADFYVTPFWEGRQGVLIELMGGKKVLFKVNPVPRSSAEVRDFIKRLYEEMIPKIIEKFRDK